MSDLREALTDELARVPVRDVDLGTIETRTRRRIRRRRTGTMALVLVVMAASLAFLIDAFEGQAPAPIQPGPVDEGWIVFHTVAWPDQPARIYRMRPDAVQPVPITDGEVDAMSPAVSPDGSSVAFVRVDEGADPPSTMQEGVYVMDADGTDVKEILRTGEPTPVSVHDLAWSPDGEQIAFLRGVGESGYELWVMAEDGSDAHPLSDLPIDSFAWSPDGSRIAFARTSSEGAAFVYDLYVMDADGSDEVRLTDDGRSRAPAWSPDGTTIAFARRIRQGVTHVYLLDPDDLGAEARSLWTGDGAFDSIAWSPNGLEMAIDLFDGDRGCFIATVGMDGATSTVLESQVGGMFAEPGDEPSLCAGSLTWAPRLDVGG